MVHGSKIKETIIAITQFDIAISPNGLSSSCRNNYYIKQVKTRRGDSISHGSFSNRKKERKRRDTVEIKHNIVELNPRNHQGK